METHIGLLLKKISEKMERRANDKREESGVTFSQGKVLWYLHTYGKKEPVTLRDIERCFPRYRFGTRLSAGRKGVRACRVGQKRPQGKKCVHYGNRRGNVQRNESPTARDGGNSPERIFR